MGDGQERTALENEHIRIVDALPGLVWTALPDGHVDFFNQRWCEYTGLSLDEARGSGWQAAIHPEELPGIVVRLRSIMTSGEPGETDTCLRRFDGEDRWFRHCFSPLRDAAGQIVKWVGVSTDIEDRRRAEAVFTGENRLLEMVASGYSLPVVLDALCQLVEETISDSYCSILLVDLTGTRFKRGAAPTFPSSYYESKDDKRVQCDSGPCGMAASLKTEVIVPDVASETRWDPDRWRAPTLKHGLRSCWTTPILSRAEKVLGTFAIYRREPGSPTAFQRELIGQFAHIASIAVERAHSDAALKQSEESFRAIVETTPECVKVIARDGTLLRVNAAGLTMAGAEAEDVVGRNFYDFLAPEDRNRYREFNPPEYLCKACRT